MKIETLSNQALMSRCKNADAMLVLKNEFERMRNQARNNLPKPQSRKLEKSPSENQSK